MKVLRTPDDRFDNLPGYAFEPNYLVVDDGAGGELRIHYLDEGDPHGMPVLLMHGEPSWSYLYRTMIPGLVAAGFRVIAPDLVGFGRSDKPTERADYTCQSHVDWMQSWLEALDLNEVVLFCQDWGGLIGLRLVTANPDRFSGVVAANTFLPTGDTAPSEAFLNWQSFSQSVPEFPVGSIIDGATVTKLSPAVIAAYDAPFPDETYKAGARQFPLLVPTTPDNPASLANRDAWKILSAWTKPFLTAFSDKDPVSAGGDKAFQNMVPGAAKQQHVTIIDGGHFLQEDKGEELAGVIVKFVADNQLGVDHGAQEG
ncbi:haloalkane dehalogenase [Arenicella xantha]|uniref:Haloalkane dehalogenase n=1 Tax=Arenicella xantha TaxID=644221 RepID=A0A395JIT4_9GAMM|nr:haloalkane dehalogenase [Arenicella xantha]RBP49793.1 haloalkane dehalogenase [Arenicella xantha]